MCATLVHMMCVCVCACAGMTRIMRRPDPTDVHAIRNIHTSANPIRLAALRVSDIVDAFLHFTHAALMTCHMQHHHHMHTYTHSASCVVSAGSGVSLCNGSYPFHPLQWSYPSHPPATTARECVPHMNISPKLLLQSCACLLTHRLPPRFFCVCISGLGNALAILAGGGSCTFSMVFKIFALLAVESATARPRDTQSTPFAIITYERSCNAP